MRLYLSVHTHTSLYDVIEYVASPFHEAALALTQRQYATGTVEQARLACPARPSGPVTAKCVAVQFGRPPLASGSWPWRRPAVGAVSAVLGFARASAVLQAWSLLGSSPTSAPSPALAYPLPRPGPALEV